MAGRSTKAPKGYDGGPSSSSDDDGRPTRWYDGGTTPNDGGWAKRWTPDGTWGGYDGTTIWGRKDGADGQKRRFPWWWWWWPKVSVCLV